MRAREADALDAVDRVARPQELPGLGGDGRQQVAAPRVDVLAEQRDLLDALPGEPLHLGENLTGATALLASADCGNDAVRALGVAAHRHLYPRLERPLVVQRQLRRERAVVEPEAAARNAVPAGAEPVAEVRDRAGAERDVDRRIELEDPLALGLCIT